MPLVHEKTLVVDGLTPVGVYARLRRDAGAGSFLLESVVPGERWGRWSILGYRPASSLEVHAGPGRDPFVELAERAAPPAAAEGGVAARFAAAHVGVVAYDIVHGATRVPPWPGVGGPVARLLAGATVIVFDNLSHTATLASLDAAALERAEADLARAEALPPLPAPDPHAVPPGVEASLDDAAYERAVERAQAHIRAGDAFQIVPARTFSAPTAGADVFDVYRALRVLSPAPYMYLLELPATSSAPAMAVAGASPETLVRAERGRVTVRPIAGTRRRGATPAEDDALASELLADPKERAEHVMLIDLARNDVGRVSRPGAVELPARMVIERFSHVMHITSEVEGVLRDGVGPWEVLRATFPAGTLTGAPKLRAMQIVRELEAGPRGVYGGAVGYVAPGGDLDFAIAIRTVVQRGDRFEVTAGAGVVADSVPELEAAETRSKARAALAAVAAAQRASAR